MEAENVLKEFGLTEYEIKAYMSLLKLGIATADHISNLGNIPLPRVYDTLVELQKKGFVLISKGRPKKFKPQKPKKALKNLIELRKLDFEKNIKTMQNDSKNVVDILSKMPIEMKTEKKNEIWTTEKRSNVRNILDEQKEIAKEEILIFSGDLSWLPETVKIIKGAIKKGVKIRTMAHESKSKEWSKNIKLAKKIGINVKVGYKGLTRGHVIDNKIVSIAIKRNSKGLNIAGNGKPSLDTLDKYELITSDNPVLVEAVKENFNFWWEKLK